MRVKHIILRKAAGVEIDVAARLIGIALVYQRGDDADIVRNAVGGRLYHIRPLDGKALTVGKKGIGIKLRDVQDRFVLPAGTFEHLILAGVGIGGEVAHIGDVHHPLDVVALIAQELLEHILHDIAAQVADMGKVVNGRAAGVHLHNIRMVRDKLLFFAGGGIV